MEIKLINLGYFETKVIVSLILLFLDPLITLILILILMHYAIILVTYY